MVVGCRTDPRIHQDTLYILRDPQRRGKYSIWPLGDEPTPLHWSTIAVHTGSPMPQTAAEILAILDLEDLGGDVFLGHHPIHSMLTKVYGGQLVGQALVAAWRTVDHTRPAH